MVTVNYQFTDAEREKFAGELLRNPNKPMDAAIAVFGTDKMGVTAYVAAEWPSDPKITEITNKLVGSKGVSEFMPTKEAAAIRIWQWTNEGPKDERIKAMKLLAEVSGWIEKPEASGEKEIHEMPPAISYVVGADHDKAPA